MRFMVIRRADRDTEAGALPSVELINAMTGYMEELTRAGILKGGDGLRPTSEACASSSPAASPS